MLHILPTMYDEGPATAIVRKDTLPFETTQLPEFYQNKAAKELKETAEQRIQSLVHIRDMLKNDPLMRNEILTDDYILQFLRARKFNVTGAFSRLKSFTELLKNNQKLATNFRFESLVTAIKNQTLSILPWRCQDGCAIFMFDADHWKPDEFSLDELKRLCVIIYLQSVRYPMSQVNGYRLIIHGKNINFKQLRVWTPQNIYLFLHGALKCFPCRYKSIHVVSETFFVKSLWTIVKNFLSEKMIKRVIFHSSKEDLLNYFPREILPVTFGGTLENYDMSHWLQRMMQPEEMEIMLGGSLKIGA